MSKINLIHQADVYFDFFEPLVAKKPIKAPVTKDMHFGEIYIFLNHILLRDGNRWYKANIQDIHDIKTSINLFD